MNTAISFLILVSLVTFSPAADWPQWRGPNRNGVGEDTKLLPTWPKGGPRLLARLNTLGAGYSGPAIVGNHLAMMGSDEKQEYLAVFSVDPLKELWRLPLGPIFRNGWGDGPRGTPTIHEKRIYTLGAQGVLLCAELTTGKEIWRTDLRKDHAGELMKGNILDVDWGYSESPLVHNNRVIVSPGGKNGTLAAFDANTGKVLWRTTTIADAAAYSSAVLATVERTPQIIQFTGGVEYKTGVLMKAPPRAVGIDPTNGHVLWEHRINYVTAGVINSPLVLDGLVYSSCGYSAGATILKLEKRDGRFQVTDITSKEARKAIAVYHGGLVPWKKTVIGFSDPHGWVCQSLPKGEALWEDKRKALAGSHILVDGRFYVVGLDGKIGMLEPDEDGWELRGEFELPGVSPLRKANGKVKVCTHPVLANGRLYIRDMETLYCYGVR